ncbi:MAG: MBL fold metallo-hydrolase [Phycisphaerales bacterium]|nr:MBL fold metallo-hydrolase [Phycisphaerales bacterium]
MLAVDNVFLTHGHMDHAAGVAYYFSQRMFIDNQPGVVFAPEPLVDPLQRLMRLWSEIDGHEPAANIVAAIADRDIPLRRDLVVRPFTVNHPCRRHGRSTVQTLGFVAIEVRQKLRPEFAGMEGPQLVELKNRGEEITRTLELPLIAYCGDTAIGPWLDRPDVRNARVLLLECTFVEPDHVDRARAGYHLHVRDLREIVPKLANERILLTHLSRRTALRDARAILREQLGEEMASRLSFFMEFRRRGGRSGATEPPPRG